MSSFSLTNSLMKRLKLNRGSLEEIRVINGSSLETINICDLNIDFGHPDPLIECSKLAQLRVLDLSRNQLKNLSEFHLPGLKELYIAGNSNFLSVFLERLTEQRIV